MYDTYVGLAGLNDCRCHQPMAHSVAHSLHEQNDGLREEEGRRGREEVEGRRRGKGGGGREEGEGRKRKREGKGKEEEEGRCPPSTYGLSLNRVATCSQNMVKWSCTCCSLS